MDETLHEPAPINNVWPYGERSGVGVKRNIEDIFSSHDVQLSEAEKNQIQEFSAALFRGDYTTDIKCDSKNDLKKIYQSSPLNEMQDFYLGYFETPEGQDGLAKLGILASEREKIIIALNDIEIIKQVDERVRKQVAADSLNWHKDQLAEQLTKNPDEDKDYKLDKPISVNYDPNKLLDKIEDLQAYRRFYRQVRMHLKQTDETLVRYAKEEILALHRSRINEMVAGLYEGVVRLAFQLVEDDNDEININYRKRLAEAMPVIDSTFLQAREDRVYGLETMAGSFSRRLDFLRNGAAWTGSGDFSPISSELATLARELKQNNDSQISKSSLDHELIERLKVVRWNADQLSQFTEDILSEWGLLSGYSATWTDVEARNGFADDAKWQVIITPKVRSLSADGSKRTLNIPEKYNRSLVQEQPAGALAVVAHELEHLVQNEFAYRMADVIPLAKIKGRHVSTMRELGAITQERLTQQLFGINRSTNTHYLSALEVKLSGGNKLEAARAFYNSYTKGEMLSPDKSKEARELSADRVHRFYRYGGHNSQPLDYVEQELIQRNLSELPDWQRDTILILGSVFDLPDLARLRRCGIVELPKDIPLDLAAEVWRIFSEKYLADKAMPQSSS